MHNYLEIPYDELAELNLEAAGESASAWGPVSVGADFSKGSMSNYLSGRASTIYGGASEVQKDVIAKKVLNL